MFDFAIVGTGLSGLLLAHRLAQGRSTPASERAPRILLIGPTSYPAGRMTLAFWSRHRTILDPWRLQTWHHLRLVNHRGRERFVSLDGYDYCAIAWHTARADLLADLASDPQVRLVDRHVDQVRDGHDAATVMSGPESWRARFVFDSRPRPVHPPTPGMAGRSRGVVMFQSFRGVWLHSTGNGVDTAAATLLDFHADTAGGFGFGYALPMAPTEIMVMAVRIGEASTSPDPTAMVSAFATPGAWHTGDIEQGTTVLQARPAPRREGRRVLAIGSRGGRVRASTGYAATRILADTDAIVQSIQRHRHPFAVPADPRRDHLLDAIWLTALAADPDSVEDAVDGLFARARIESVLPFLDGGAAPRDLLAVIAALPPRPFAAAALSLAGLQLGGIRRSLGPPS